MVRVSILVIAILLGGCDSRSGSNEGTQTGSPAVGTTVTDNEVRVLFLGNSHTAPIPQLLNEIYARNSPSTKTTFKKFTGGGFLEHHANSRPVLDSIRKGDWDYVILQAQKYSTSGKYTYPTDGAIKLANLARKSGAKVIMYPEWSRRDVPDEYIRIRKIHESIAKETDATVAPIGEAWKLALENDPNITLYAEDGNHASRLGSYLVASVFYSMIKNKSPESDSTETTQSGPSRMLEKAAWQVVSGVKPGDSTLDDQDESN